MIISQATIVITETEGVLTLKSHGDNGSIAETTADELVRLYAAIQESAHAESTATEEPQEA